MLNKNRRNRLVMIIFVFSVFLGSFLISNSNLNSFFPSEKNDEIEIRDLKLSTGTLVEENLSVNEGDNLWSDTNYDFNGYFYDSANLYQEFDGAYLETEYDSTFNISANDSISANNTDLFYPTSLDFESGGVFGELGDNWKYLDNETVKIGSIEGYYIGTGSDDFNEEAIGTSGSNIEFVYFASTPAGWVRIEEEENGHKNVMEIYDTGSLSYVTQARNSWGQQTYGTMEFWWMVSSTSLTQTFEIYQGGSYGIIWYIQSGQFKAFNYRTLTNIGFQPTANEWFHVRLDFDCTSGGYMGLSADRYNIWINGELTASNWRMWGSAGMTYLDRQFIQSSAGGGAHYSWYDAFSFTWKSDYEQWGNIDPSTYVGNYGGTYDFKDETTWITTGENLDFVDYTNDNDSVDVEFEVGNHRKILDIYDNDNTDFVELVSNFTSIQTDETIEFWWRSPSTDPINFSLVEDSTKRIILQFYSNNFTYYNGTQFLNISTYNVDTWYHQKIIWNDTLNTFDWYINSSLVGDDLIYASNSTTGIVGLNMITNVTESNYHHYFDSFGYNFDPSYTIGDNLISDNFILNFTFYLNSSSIQNILSFNSTGYWNTSIYLNVSWYIYDYSGSAWELLSSSFPYPSQTLFSLNSTNLSKYIGSNGIWMKFYAINSSELYLEYDKFEVRIKSKLYLSYTKSFSYYGTWRYRFHILGSDFYSDWLYFYVLEYGSIANVEIISESEYYTSWDFVNVNDTTSLISNETFEDSPEDWYLDGDADNDLLYVQSFYDGYIPESFINWTNNGTIADYSGSNYASGDSPVAFEFYSGYWYVADHYSQTVRKYDSDWVYVTSYAFHTGMVIHDIIYANGFFWLEADTGYVYKYTTGLSYTGLSYWVAGNDVLAYSVMWSSSSGSYWVSGATTKKVYEFNTTWDYTGVSYSVWIGGSAQYTPKGMTEAEGYYWVLDRQYDNVHRFYTNWTYSGYSFNFGTYSMYDPTDIRLVDEHWYILNWVSSTYRFNKYAWINKTLQYDSVFGIQTNRTETLTLKSQNNLNISVFYGDHIDITFNTTSGNRIEFGVLDDGGSTIESFELVVQGNTDYSTRTITFLVGSGYEIDQYYFSGIFDEKENLIIDTIEVSRIPIENTVYVDSDGYKHLFMNHNNSYNVFVYENGALVEIFNITTSETMQTLIYEKVVADSCYFTYYDVNGEYLDFEDYTTYINYTLDGILFENKRLSENVIYVDQDSLIEYEIYDSFDISVKSGSTYEITFIDIILDIYLLKIKNQALENVDYSLSKLGSLVIKQGNIFLEEIVEFAIASGNYTLEYTNYEDSVLRSYNFYLSSSQLININTTYNTVYFSMFTYDGLGVDPSLVRFYINDERKDFGRNIIQSDTANLIILDFFNNTLANETIDARIYSEYNLFVEIYSLIILNQFTYEDIVVNITQVGSGVWMEQIIPKQFGLTYRFLPNVEYNITIHFTNATFYSSRIVNLTDNSHIESFGEPTLPAEYPKDVYFSAYTGTGLAIQQQLLKFYIDGDRADFGFNTIENAMVNITVRDFFNTTLFSQIINTTGIYEYDISIDIFSLKIKNEAYEIANYTLNLGALTDTGNILPDEIIEYQLSTNSYIFEYTNQEDNSFGSISFTLDEDKVYILNSTYYDIYISIFDTSGSINWNNVKFYINNTRTDFGFQTLSSDYANLKVLDYFNSTLFNQDILLRGLNEYNIYVSLYSFKIYNDASLTANYTLKLGSIEESGNILPQEIIEYLLASNTYDFNFTNNEDGSLHENTIILNQDYVLRINTTYYDIYFGIYDTSGTLDWNHVKFYINTTRTDFGFNTLTSDYANLKVLDYFNSTLFDQDVLLRGLNEYSIYITLYSLKIYNDASLTANYTLKLGSVEESGNILPQEIIEYLLASNTYDFNFTNNEDGSLHENTIILNQNRVLRINTTYYDIYLGIYDTSGTLDWNHVKFYINNTRTDFGFNTLTSDYANLKVLDYFNSTLFDQDVLLRGLDEYSIYITLYSLKIYNDASLTANYTLKLGSVEESGNILPQEIIEYLLASNTYDFNFTNNEDGSLHENTIILNQNYVLKINTTYYDVYFALYNYDGLGLDRDLFRFYINGDRKDFGFNELSQTINTLIVKDYFGAILYNSLVDTSQYAEFNILVEVYTLILNNNFTHSIEIVIERNDLEFRQIIPAQASISYRFLPDIEYTIYYYDVEGDKIGEIEVELGEDNLVVSFGFYDTTIPVDPTPLINSMNILVWFAIFIIFVMFIIIVLYVRFKREKASIPIELKRYIKKKSIKSNTNKSSYSNKDIYID